MTDKKPEISEMSESESHPLEHAWAIWEQRSADKKNMSAQEWADLQKRLCEFDTVEGFWRCAFVLFAHPACVARGTRMRERVPRRPAMRVRAMRSQESKLAADGF